MCASVPATAFDLAELDRRPGQITCKIFGKGALAKFKNEAGGHRIQHVPAHDKRGRMHTSNLTVAVLPEPTEVELRLDPRDLEIATCRGSGAGGQHRNMTSSAVQVTHKPSGLMVRCESERSQHQNKANAITLLKYRLLSAKRQTVEEQRAQDRRSQVGVGARADRRRSYYFQRDLVVDHLLDKTWKLKEFFRGNW